MLENYYSWGQWLLFCKEIHFVTKYRIQGHIMCELSWLCYWNTHVNFHVIWSLATLGFQNRNKVVRQPKHKHKSKLVLSKISPQQLEKNCHFCLAILKHTNLGKWNAIVYNHLLRCKKCTMFHPVSPCLITGHHSYRGMKDSDNQ